MRKLCRRALCLVMILCLLLPGISPVLAAKQAKKEQPEEPQMKQLHIASVQSFLEFAENCRLDSFSENLMVILDTDLDLSQTDFQGIPIFCGELDGKNHRITGLHITAPGSHQGMIRYLREGASVKNLHVQGTVSPEGSQNCIGGIVGSNSGTLESCHFDGQVAGKNDVGGIAGQNTVTGILSNCYAQGQIRAEHRMGGIVGQNQGVVSDCKNNSSVNTSSQDNIVQVSSITMETLKGTEDPNTVTDAGGIAGTNAGVLRSCTNRGNVGYRHMGYNIGGIAGSQSGYIAECRNYGTIYGRKEAGGIAGQFIPMARIEYSEDTLQILDRQLNAAAASLNRASYNAQSNLGYIGEGIHALREQSETARAAIHQMLPGHGNLLDPDQFIAAKNVLGQSLRDMHDTMGDMGQAAGGVAGQLASDLKNVAGQLTAMAQTLRRAKETTKATLNDVSDKDTPEDLTAKIEQCVNCGNVSGDINAGGITGSIAFESGRDPEEDVEVDGNRSLNAAGELRAVVLDCENKGSVTGKKAYTGGIVGRTTMGLIRNCINTGSVLGEKAQHVGGIAGESQGYIRSCHVKCKLSGNSYVGGIAGSGTIVTDCLSMVLLEDVTELQGAVLGSRESSRDEKETDPIRGNYYMCLSEDPGAIDGISYRNQAEPMAPTKFISQDDLPQAFQKTVLTFRYEDGKERELVLPVGSSLRSVQIPMLPAKEGYTGRWDGLEEYAESRVYFDTTFSPLYEADHITIRSRQTRENGRPILLAEGTFSKMDHIDMTVLEDTAVPERTVLEAWELPDFRSAENTVLHLSIPEGADPEYLQVLLQDKDGQWRTVSTEINASYLIFSASPRDQAMALEQLPDYTSWFYILGGIAGLILLSFLLCLRKRKKQKHSK